MAHRLRPAGDAAGHATSTHVRSDGIRSAKAGRRTVAMGTATLCRSAPSESTIRQPCINLFECACDGQQRFVGFGCEAVCDQWFLQS